MDNLTNIKTVAEWEQLKKETENTIEYAREELIEAEDTLSYLIRKRYVTLSEDIKWEKRSIERNKKIIGDARFFLTRLSYNKPK